MNNVSIYKDTFANTGTTTDIDAVLNSIKKGVYKDRIISLRTLFESNISEYSKNKSLLPAVTFSGVFGERRKKECLITYSGFLIFDIDKLDKNQLIESKVNLEHDNLVYAVWISPSNRGLKFLVRTHASPVEHKMFFQIILQLFEKKYSVILDRSGSDISRLCYVSYDPDLNVNYDSLVVTRSYIEDNGFLDETNTSISEVMQLDDSAKEIIINGNHNRGKGKNSPSDRQTIKKIISFLSLNKKSITGTYENWFRVALSIANSFSYDVGLKYYLELCRLDENLHDEDKSIKLLRYCYDHKQENKIKFNTIVYLAQQEGFEQSRPISIPDDPS